MALSANSPMKIGLGSLNEIPAGAGAHPYEGGAVGLSVTGYAQALEAGDRFLGHAFEECDNSAGAAAAKNVKVRQGRYRAEVTIASVAITDVGKKVYMSDDATYSLTRSASALLSLVGVVKRYVAANTAEVEFEAMEPGEPFVAQLDCQTTVDTADHMLLPAWMNVRGVLVLGVYGIISESFSGSIEDQGIVTVYDEDDNVLCTLTPTDGSADAVGDVIAGTVPVLGSATGVAVKTVAAGKAIDCKVTQDTEGTVASGKMNVHLLVKPLL